MKKILLFLGIIILLGFSACSSSDEKVIVEEKTNFVEDTINEVSENIVDTKNQVLFNTNLTDYEQKWLTYFEEKYPNSRIYHIETQLINCENCYSLSYKKDLEILKVKILKGEKVEEKRVGDVAVEIKDAKVCSLFGGNWNECPKLCPTDEEACITQCGLPVCEFDYNTIKYIQEGEVCGGLDLNSCDFGLTCYYESLDADTGVCVKK